MFISEIKQELVNIFEDTELEFVGCTIAEIESLKEKQQVGFIPDLYRQLMLEMGHKGIDSLFVHLHCLFKDVETLKNDSLPPDAFVFMEDPGVNMFYFRTNDLLDDPPVYISDNDQAVADRFSEFVESFIDTHWQAIESDQQGQDAYYYDASTGEFSVLPPRHRPKR